LAAYTDTVWQARNSSRPGMAAALHTPLPQSPTDSEEVAVLVESVAAVSFKKKHPQQKKFHQRTAARKGGSAKVAGFVCWKHTKFGDQRPYQPSRGPAAASAFDSGISWWPAATSFMGCYSSP